VSLTQDFKIFKKQLKNYLRAGYSAVIEICTFQSSPAHLIYTFLLSPNRLNKVKSGQVSQVKSLGFQRKLQIATVSVDHFLQLFVILR